jgi:hypothetical protein
MKELEWHPATRVDLLVEMNDSRGEDPYPVNSVAFVEGWIFARNQNGTKVFPTWRVVKVVLG